MDLCTANDFGFYPGPNAAVDGDATINACGSRQTRCLFGHDLIDIRMAQRAPRP